MFNEFRYRSLVKTRRLLLPMGVAFALILFVQYFELPYGNILPSLFSAGKFQAEPIDKFPGWDLSSYPNGSRNLTHSSSLIVTNVNVADEVSNIVEVSDEKDSGITNVKDAFDSESVKNIGAISDDDIDPEEEFPSNDLLDMNDTSTDQRAVRDNSSVLENTGDIESPLSKYTSESDSSLDHHVVIPPVALSPSNLQSYFTSPENLDTSPSTYVTPATITSSMGKDAEDILLNNENPKIHSNLGNYSAITSIPVMKKSVKEPSPAVLSISKMNELLLQSHVSYRAMKPRWSSTVDQELRNVKSLIENTAIIEKDPQFDVSLYRNFSAFKRSYELMEQILKVYVYAEGERPIFHQPPLKGIYASEGWFMKQLKSNKKVITKNPKKAHLFYLPFSSRELEIALYVPNSHNRENMYRCLSNYVDTIATKYHFWNRTTGADHFLVACHDWGPAETRQVMANCIRALCNSDVKEGFQFGKDVSLPETYVHSAQNPLRQLGGKPPSQRRILAFFAGNMHGYLRPILLNHWENKDPDMKINGLLRKVKGEMSYAQYMKSSKYCICAKGYEVNSPRVVEAIFYECVPVIISDNFVPPFFETLNWESFAVFVLEKDIPNLKNILLSIPKKRYLEMQRRVKKVQQHFLWHSRPVKYDVFHMILHSIWYSRVFQT